MDERLCDLLQKVRSTAAVAGDAAADVAYATGKKATELLSAAKLRIRIAGLQGDVNTALREAGELLYATHTGNPTDSDVLLAKLSEIDELKAQIARLEEALGRETAAPVCPTCNAKAKEGDPFCGECGGPL